MDWKTLFLQMNGRIGRRDFWIGFVILFVANLILGLIPVLGQIIGLVLIWPAVAIYAKRLHDMGKTAWLCLIPFGVFLVAGVIAVVMGGAAVIGAGAAGGGEAATGAAIAGMGMAAGIMGLAALVGLAFLLWVGLTPSQPGDNAYGAFPTSLVSGGGAPPPTTPTSGTVS